MIDPSPKRPRAVLLGVQLPEVSDGEFASSLAELERLARTLGLDVVDRVTQRRNRLATPAVVGGGKLKELARLTGGTGVAPVGPPEARRRQRRATRDDVEAFPEEEFEEADGPESDDDVPETEAADSDTPTQPELATLVLVDHDVSPRQTRNLERATDAEVLDRTAVILAIFQRHARSREARLQVEMARLSYLAPRLRETGGGRDRQGGGIGAKGAGESAIELDRRKLRDRIAELRAELAAVEHESGTRRKRRGGQNTVALVGYTNAGKSSAMRVLTGSGVLVEDKLFATLDTTVRALQPETKPRVLVSDTVGFIKKLPHDLVASFRSTLDEAREAELLLHFVDASDPAFPAQIDVTAEVLRDIGATDVARTLVLNKIDKVDAAERARLAAAYPHALHVSVRDPSDVVQLREHIVGFFERDMVEEDLVIPYAKQKLVGAAYAACRVVAETHDEHGTQLRLRARPEVIAQLRAELAQGTAPESPPSQALDS